MSKRPKILFLSSSQFGFSTTLFKICEVASRSFDITYVGWDYGNKKVTVEGVEVIYVSREKSLLSRNYDLLKTFHEEIRKGYDLIFATYSRGISLVKILNPGSLFVLYIDTLGVQEKNLKRKLYDLILGIETSCFRNLFLVSHGIAKILKRKDYELLPLGGECYTTKLKPLDQIALLYVGTLDNRNMLECVKGFHLYLERNELNGATFKIIGDGPFNELEEIQKYIKNNNLEKSIFALGFKPREELTPLYNESNIGVSFVPMKPYYEHQPPTKTYEYLISGLPVIATNTLANRRILRKEAGVLVKDTAESFAEGIEKIGKLKGQFDRELIKKEYSVNTWENVVKHRFIPLVEGLIARKN